MVNEIEVIGGTPGWASPPAYDAAGNMNSFPQPASPSSAYTAVYDAWNRMVSISGTGGTVATYQYDGRNRRIVKYITAISETRHFYWTNNWQDIEERTGSSTSMDKQYVWGARYIDELVCRDDATPLRLYLAQDANFNVTALISTSGVLQQRFLYDPYGNAFALTSSWASTTDGYTWARRFTGQFFDSETELYYNRARYLDLPTFSGRSS
jgi:YD repeat-containing protein